MPGSAQIGNLAVNLSLETASFTMGAAKARREAEGLKGSLGGLGGVMKTFGGGLVAGLGIGALSAGLVSLTSNAFAMGSALAESSEKVGVSVEALQELNLAAEQSGVSQETLAGAMAKLNRAMGDLQNGKKAAVDAFAAIGLSAEDLKGKTPDQALRLVADALNNLPDVQQRVAIGAQIMGRGFSELLPLINGGSKALDDYAAKSRAQGQISTEEAKRLDELADSWDRMKTKAGVATAQVIAMFAEFASKADAWTLNWYKNRDAFLGSLGSMATSAVTYVSNMVTGIGEWMGGKLTGIFNNAKQRIQEVKAKFHEMYDAVVGHSYVPDMVQGIASEFAQLGRIMVDPTISAADKVGAAFQSLQGVVAKVLGSKAGGIFGMLSNFAPLFASLLGGSGKALAFGPTSGGAPSLAGLASAPTPIKFARGGSGVFGGMGGVDKNLLSLNGSPIARVSRGEHFQVSPANNSGGGVLRVELNDPLLDARISTGANVEIVRNYPAIRAGTLQAQRETRRRSARG